MTEMESFERPSAGYSITACLKILHRPGSFAQIAQFIASAEGQLAEIGLVYSDFNYTIRNVTIECKSEEHGRSIIEGLKKLEVAKLLESQDNTFAVHEGGKLRVIPAMKLENTDQLSRVYTPGVARVCTAIHQNPAEAYKYTIKARSVAVVTDGSAVLGLGNIGPLAALPVMEGKAILFKQFADLDAYPICLDTQDTEEIIRAIKYISPGFGAINIEDISSPRCFEIEKRLTEELDIPVFHDDQHGTAIVVLAGLINSLKIADKKLADIKVVVNGFGAGGVACTRMLLRAGVKNIVPCDRAGIVYRGRTERMNSVKEELINRTNPDNIKGTVADAMRGADVFIGVSKPGSINRSMVQSMASNPIVFALANPVPEIMPDEIKDIARIIATGRSDYANQINNVLCFPGIFRGALDARSRRITDDMKLAAAFAIASAVEDDELSESCIIPGIFKTNVAERVAQSVKKCAEESKAETRR